jgi:hypothetical protein
MHRTTYGQPCSVAFTAAYHVIAALHFTSRNNFSELFGFASNGNGKSAILYFSIYQVPMRTTA